MVIVYLLFIVGIFLLIKSANWIVDGSSSLAKRIGVSSLMIGLTIVAFGTSLPELVVSVIAALKGNVDLAVGNIIGSNIFNIFWVLGIVPLISPLKIPAFVGFDIGLMFLTTLVLFIFMFTGKRKELTQKEGVVFILFYILYILFIIVRG